VCRPDMRIATDFALAIRAVVYAIFQCFGADLLDVYEAAGLLNDLPGVEILKLVNRMSNAASIGGMRIKRRLSRTECLQFVVSLRRFLIKAPGYAYAISALGVNLFHALHINGEIPQALSDTPYTCVS
jgi:hypothetical protein